MKKLYLSKHKNGYYYIYYKDDNGKRQSITTKTKRKSETYKVLSNFDQLIKKKNKFDPKQIVLPRILVPMHKLVSIMRHPTAVC